MQEKKTKTNNNEYIYITILLAEEVTQGNPTGKGFDM